MARALSVNMPDAAQAHCILSLISATDHVHGDLVEALKIFARTVFGAEKTDEAIRQHDMESEGEYMNGGFGGTGALTSIMRTWVALTAYGDAEKDNADALMKLVDGYWPADVVAVERARVEGGG